MGFLSRFWCIYGGCGGNKVRPQSQFCSPAPGSLSPGSVDPLCRKHIEAGHTDKVGRTQVKVFLFSREELRQISRWFLSSHFKMGSQKSCQFKCAHIICWGCAYINTILVWPLPLFVPREGASCCGNDAAAASCHHSHALKTVTTGPPLPTCLATSLSQTSQL